MTIVEEDVEAQAANVSEFVAHMSRDPQLPKDTTALETSTLCPTVAKNLGSTPARQENVAPAGYVSGEWLVLVHTPVTIQDAMRIPGAKAAIDTEWQTLWKKGIWDASTVREKDGVIREARTQSRTVNIGKVIPLCFIKNSQLPEAQHVYKGRVVLRGNCINDDTWCFAVFSEQGTSASHMAASNMLAALAHMPDMEGQDADACGAYTQSDLHGDDTWVELPQHQWAASWHGKYTTPFCRLIKALYGHPKAGLYWEQHRRQALNHCGAQPALGWE